MANNPLDKLLGDGAFDEYSQASIFKIGDEVIDVAQLTVGDYDIDATERIWPPEEASVVVTATWQHGTFTTIFSQDTAYVQEASGCGITIQQDMFEIFMKQSAVMMISGNGTVSLFNWVRKWGIEKTEYLVPENLVDCYLSIGCFEDRKIESENKKFSVMIGESNPSSRYSQWFEWAGSGCQEELKPDWVTE